MARERLKTLRRNMVRAGCAAAGALLLLLAVFAAIWQMVGFPAPVSRAVRTAAHRRGLLLDFSRIRLDLPRGVVIEDLTATSGPGPIHLRFEAASISLRPRPRSLFSARGLELYEAVVHRGRLSVLEEADVRPAVSRTAILADAKLRFGEDGIEIRRIQGAVLDLRLDVRGRIRVAELDPLPVTFWQKRAPVDRPPVPVRWPDLAGHLDHWYRLRELSEEFRWTRAPVFRIDLDLDFARPERTRTRVRMAGGAGTWSDTRIEDVQGDLEWEAGRVRVSGLEAKLSHGDIRGSGVWCLQSDRVHARFEGEGAWAFFRTGLPRRLSAVLNEARVAETGMLEWTWAWDDVPRAELGRKGQGWLRWTDGRVDALALPVVEFRIDWDRPRLEFNDVRGRLGEGALAGAIAGRVVFDVDRRHVDAVVEGGFDPALLLPWLLPYQARYVGGVVFLSEPPTGRGRIAGSWAQRRSMRMDLEVSGRDFVYNGAYVESAAADVVLEDAILTLRSMRIRRPEGELTGWVLQDLEASKAEFDVESSISPHAIARMIGPAAHRFAQRFRFGGPAHMSARGRVEAGRGWDNAFTVEFEGTDFGMDRFVAQQAVFRAVVDERTIRVEEAHGIYAGGLFEGRATFILSEDGASAPAYDAEGRVEDVDLAALASDVLREDTDVYEGRMGAEVRLRGRIGAGQGPTVKGDGRMEIRGAGLLRIPVLGGLSTWLARVYPGLGFVTQDVMTAEFAVGESRVASDSIALRGTVISLDARGDVHFDGRLNCRAQVRLLREGVAAEAVRVLTFPLTKLLEFDLVGTFSEPRWRPRNFSLD